MATLLLLDGSDVAGRAMRGILGRANHRCAVTGDPGQAWRWLREGVAFDLVVVEARLAEGDGLGFVQRLRADWFFRELPVVIYTGDSGPAFVKRAMALHVQNYLLKPYEELVLHGEIAKALAFPWRAGHFRDAKALCAEAGITAEVLRDRRQTMIARFEAAARTFPGWAEERQDRGAFEAITALIREADAAGISIGVEILQHLRTQAETEHWAAFASCADWFSFASRLIFSHLHPAFTPDCSDEPRPVTSRERTERINWESADVTKNGPLLDPAVLQKEVAGLAGCPVVASAAAAFQMVAAGRATRMSQMMDLAAFDPGVAAQVLAAANRSRRDDMDEIEDPRVAANQLGEAKLGALAGTFPIVDDAAFALPPVSWSSFWTFQAGVGRVAQFVCAYLEFDYLAGHAATAGLLHDLGRLLLLQLHPYAMKAILTHARERHLTVADAERSYLGCTTRELAIGFAEAQHLPAPCRHVIRWLDAPALAMRDMDLVAIVAVARQLCLHARVGSTFELPVAGQGGLAGTPAWRVLEGKLFPSFDLRKFELQAHAFCLTVRNELSGRTGEGRPSHAQRAAELV